MSAAILSAPPLHSQNHPAYAVWTCCTQHVFCSWGWGDCFAVISDFVTMRRHSPRAFANPSQKSHSGFAHVGSDGLRRLTNKSKPGITCEHASRACFICHLRMVTSAAIHSAPPLHSQNHPACTVCTCCTAACVLLMGVGRLLRSFTVNKQPCVQASLTHG